MASNYGVWGWSGSGYGERIYLEVWHSRTIIDTNKSVFGAKIYNNSNNSFGDTGAISWKLADQWNTRKTGSRGNTPTTGYNQVKTYQDTFYFEITHEKDGTCPDVNFVLTINRELGNINSSTVRVTLRNIPTIPRHSTATFPSSFNLGDTFTIKFDRQSTSFYHRVNLRYGDTLVWAGTGNDECVVDLDRIRMLNLTPTTNVATLSLLYTTRVGNDNLVGATTKNITCNLNAPNPAFSSITHSENQSNVSALGVGYIQSLSRLKVAITGAVAGTGASIRNYRITIDGQALNSQSGTTLPLSKSGTLDLVGTVTDSRGLSASKTVKVSVLSYEPPSITKLSAIRTNSAGAKDDYGSYVKFEVGYKITPLSNKNAKNLIFEVKNLPNNRELTTYTGTFTEIISGFSVNSSFPYKITVKDSFNSTVSASTILAGKITMLWGRDFISVGTAEHNGSGTVTAEKALYQNKRIVSDFNTAPEDVKSPIDFNNYWKHGVYTFSDNAGVVSSMNSPVNEIGRLEVYTRFDYFHQSTPSTWQYVFQIYTTFYGREFLRYGGTGDATSFMWGAWEETVRLVEEKKTPGGTYEKWSNGKLVQRGLTKFTNGTTQAFGGVFRSQNVQRVNFPVAFKSVDTIQLTTNGSGAFGVGYNSNNNEQFTARLVHYVSQTVDVDVAWEAVGSWK